MKERLCMSIVNTIVKAGRSNRTLMLTAAGKDGILKTVEVEPYVYRQIDGSELLYCYDTHENNTKIYDTSNIVSIEETQNTFYPRYPVVI